MLQRMVIKGIIFTLVIMLGGCASSGKKSAEGLTDQEWEELMRKEYKPVPHDKSTNWQIEGGALKNISPQDIKLVAPNRLLLILGSGYSRSPFLFDTETGALVWIKRLFGCDDSIVNNKFCEVDTAFIAVYENLIVLRSQGNAGTKLVALDLATGDQRWSVDLTKLGELHLFTNTSTGALFISQHSEHQAILRALDLATGAVVWKSETVYGSGTVEPPAPVTSDDSIWHSYNGVAKLSAKDGRVAWHRQDILTARQAPPMQLDNGHLYVVDGKNTLHILDPDTGKTLASAKQRDNVIYTNISPSGDWVYLRGVENQQSNDPRFFVTAVRGIDGKELWIDTDKNPSVSNLIDENGTLYFSTPFTLIALDRKTGSRRFAVNTSEIGKSFPVQIRKYGDRVVYVGELVIAAYNAKTGKEMYRHGFDPVNQTAHMDALNDTIERTQKYLSYFSGPFSGIAGIDFKGAGMSNFFFQQARESQNQADSLAREASQHAKTANTTGSRLEASRSEIKYSSSTISRTAANAQFSMGMAFMTVENIQQSLAKASAPDRARLEELLMMRKLLYRAYVGSLQGDYVYRPTNESGMVGISLIHLPSGRMKHTPLTPEYSNLGIYNLIDFEKGVVFHQGVRSTEGLKGYFMSRPIHIPK